MHPSPDVAEGRSGLIYRHAQLYRLSMWLLYRGQRDRELALVLDAVPPGASVVDLCCGDCLIAPSVLAQGCSYLGLDVNQAFLRSARRRGLDVRYWAGNPDEIPEAQVICMLSSLYQFIPEHEHVVAAMLARAKARVIIAEPIRNWATSSFPLARRLAASLTRVNGRTFPDRLSEADVQALAELVRKTGGSATLTHLPREIVLVIDVGRRPDAL